jgi:DeoR family transcriptional regulator, ulaG and ulaABCDEF operon transcriptional repressor
MHSTEREKLILDCLAQGGFISFRDLSIRMNASPATIRRDLSRLVDAGVITRVHGGAKLTAPSNNEPSTDRVPTRGLMGVPFHENIHRNRRQKELVGREAARLCTSGEAVMIDGGSTTLQMCAHLAGLNLQVLTNSLHIVTALLSQTGTRVVVPGGQVFPEQNIILSVALEDDMPRFHAPRLFMGAAALGPAGLMQADFILVSAERRLIDRADEIIVLVDSSKFEAPSGHVVCRLEEIDVIITDEGIGSESLKMLERNKVNVIIARETMNG